MKTKLINNIEAANELKLKVLNDPEMISRCEKISEICIYAYQNQKKILFCGNGGSAADAQHLAAELSGRFYYDRPPLFAEALHVNTSFITAVGNDYGYNKIFSRLVKAFGEAGDVLICLTTSGNSENILNAAGEAKSIGMSVVGMTGETGGKLKEGVDVLINIPSNDTPRIQEVHMLIGHTLCEQIEATLFPKN